MAALESVSLKASGPGPVPEAKSKVMASPIDVIPQRRYNSLRLSGFDYASAKPIYFITMDTEPWRPLFADFTLAKHTLSSLLNPITQQRMPTLAYTLMPDHLHLLVRGVEGESLSSAIGKLKGFTTSIYWKRSREVLRSPERRSEEKSGFARDEDKRPLLAALTEWRATLRPEAVQLKEWPRVRHQFFLSKQLWKPSFFDHITRNDEDMRETIRYILMNSVRRGYVSKSEYYPFTGLGGLDGWSEEAQSA